MGTDEIFNLGVSLNLKTTLLNYTKQGTNQVYDDDYWLWTLRFQTSLIYQVSTMENGGW